MFVGLEERITKELKTTNNTVNVTASPERNYTAWLGGSIMASLPIFSVSFSYNSSNIPSKCALVGRNMTK
jgi:actin-related protein